MHLTNFAINFESSGFVDTASDETGSKRSVAAVLRQLGQSRAEQIWADIALVTSWTLLGFAPKLRQAYRNYFGGVQPAADGKHNSVCFEVLGFDFLVDENLKVYMLEVNSAPSMASATSLDTRVKGEVLRETFALLQLDPTSKRMHAKTERTRLSERRDQHTKQRREKMEKGGVHVAFGSSTKRTSGNLTGSGLGIEPRSHEMQKPGVPPAPRAQAKTDADSDEDEESSSEDEEDEDDDEEEDDDDDDGSENDIGNASGTEETDSDEETVEGVEFPEGKVFPGVGPFVTPHLAQLLPNQALSGHDTILAAAETLVGRTG